MDNNHPLNYGQYKADTYSNTKELDLIQSTWIHDEYVPDKPCPQKTWRYYIMCLTTGKIWAEYTDIDEAYRYKKYYKNSWVHSYEPTIEELIKEERLRKNERNFQSGYSG